MGCLPLLGSLVAGGGADDAEAVQRHLLKSGTHDTSLPVPGELVFHDFRRSKDHRRSPEDSTKPMRIVQWNIQRGYQLEAVIEELSLLDADIIALQEIDIGCDRSSNADVGVEIARRLGMNYVFLCEFTELRSTRRNAASQGGGAHGNGVLTRYDILSAECISHSHHPIPWEDQSHHLSRAEPRVGERVTLAATVDAPSGPVVVYSAHLEVFCGALSRMRQFADILRHSRRAAGQGVARQIICGDLNTSAHGVARLSPFHCTDHLRWATLGYHEAEVWQDNIFDVAESKLASSCTDPPQSDEVERLAPRNERVWNLGLHDDEVCRELVNPGFEEVFPILEPTLDHPLFRILGFSLMHGKLDWLLHRGGFTVVDKAMGNHNYEASDHKWLAADLRPDSPSHQPRSGRRQAAFDTPRHKSAT